MPFALEDLDSNFVSIVGVDDMITVVECGATTKLSSHEGTQVPGSAFSPLWFDAVYQENSG